MHPHKKIKMAEENVQMDWKTRHRFSRHNAALGNMYVYMFPVCAFVC